IGWELCCEVTGDEESAMDYEVSRK
ncbi:MAG: hypothetical protein QOJ04_3639, partial [Caballeronia sp.]|nr:hypothetical protein [Caballeronia sp.]